METTTSSDLGKCGACGVAVRPNTFYCYNCGTKIVKPAAAESNDMNGSKASEVSGEAEAASLVENRGEPAVESAKTRRRRPRPTTSVRIYEAVWVPEAPRSNIFVIAVSLFVAMIVILAVYLIKFV